MFKPTLLGACGKLKLSEGRSVSQKRLRIIIVRGEDGAKAGRLRALQSRRTRPRAHNGNSAILFCHVDNGDNNRRSCGYNGSLHDGDVIYISCVDHHGRLVLHCALRRILAYRHAVSCGSHSGCPCLIESATLTASENDVSDEDQHDDHACHETGEYRRRRPHDRVRVCRLLLLATKDRGVLHVELQCHACRYSRAHARLQPALDIRRRRTRRDLDVRGDFDGRGNHADLHLALMHMSCRRKTEAQSRGVLKVANRTGRNHSHHDRSAVITPPALASRTGIRAAKTVAQLHHPSRAGSRRRGRRWR
eukprot:scaffold320342_cov28-Tisochrysis_lutea.AAC.3